MPERVIRDKRVENDLWETLGLAGDVPQALPHGPILVPVAAWKARRDEILARREPFGVWLGPDDDPALLADDLALLQAIGVHFPKWGDGRGFSTGALLRGRYDYGGELRAFGDLGRDHLLHLTRCGFDVVKLGPRHDPEMALAAFSEYSVLYQAAIDEPMPFFRRRVANGL
jgi:uncharacterized protein (DUF934 family)